MSVQRPHLVRLAWIVSFTILLAALLPSFAQAVMAQQRSGFVEICSAMGSVAMAAPVSDTKDGRGDPASSSSSMNCPCCAIHHGAPSLPPPAMAWQLPTTLRFERPQRFLQAPRPLFAWAPALARGPPSLA